jgi:hypothetical protein
MKPRVTLITLCFDDLERAVQSQDSDGHVWEDAWNPNLLPQE